MPGRLEPLWSRPETRQDVAPGRGVERLSLVVRWQSHAYQEAPARQVIAIELVFAPIFEAVL